MTITIRKMPLASMCRCPLPILSAGGIQIGEEFCLLPVRHVGPHQGPHGQVMVNMDERKRWLDGDPV